MECLLEKVIQIMVAKCQPQRRTSDAEFRRMESKLQSGLTNLFLSGKEGATAVRTILSQQLVVAGDNFNIKGDESDDDDEFDFGLHKVYLKNFALRWTRSLRIKAYFNLGEKRTSDQLPKWLPTVRSQNSVEKLYLKHASEVCRNVALVEACPNLAVLVCTPGVLVSLLNHFKAPFFPKLHTIETTEYYDWSLIFTHMTKNPTQCLFLDTLQMQADRFKLMDLANNIRHYSIPTVKTLIIATDTKCCTAVDVEFSMLASICAAFPNLEKASLTVNADCEHQTPKLPFMTKIFGTFIPEVQYTVNYKLEHKYVFSSEELDRFEDRLETFLGNGTISIDEEDGEIEYSLATSYHNIEMKVTLEYKQLDDEVLTDPELELENSEDEY